MAAMNALSRQEWARRISTTWHGGAGTMVDAIIAVARDLQQAKSELEHGEYMLMFEKEEVPFSYQKANKFIRISDSPKILEFSHERILPPDWNTLYLLTRLGKKHPGVFDRMVADGTINSTMGRGDVSKVLRLLRVAEDEARVLSLRPKPGKYRTLVIDPAWEYDWLSLAGRAKPGYAMQTLDELRILDLKQWADEEAGCHLYCWVTNNFMAEGCKLVANWGFQHRTVLTWSKPPPFGLGSYFRNSTEHVLFATLGETTTRPAAASIPTHFEAPRGEHSEKPEKFYEIVRAASYPPYGEGNQREARTDFTNLFESIDAATAMAAE
jgi:N6-adenosine-specific RNA methylase IME4